MVRLGVIRDGKELETSRLLACCELLSYIARLFSAGFPDVEEMRHLDEAIARLTHDKNIDHLQYKSTTINFR